MDYHRILQLIFGVNFSKEEAKDFVNCLELVGKYLDEKLENFSETDDIEREKGVIQPQGKIIVWDIDDEDISNLAKISKDRLTLTSSTAFSTLKANACIFAGRFMYEVQLRSKGVMQVMEKAAFKLSLLYLRINNIFRSVFAQQSVNSRRIQELVTQDTVTA